MRPGGPTFYWPEVNGSVGYVVLRAVDGTNNWTIAGSSCASPNGVRKMQAGQTSWVIEFDDISGGVVPNTPYVYQVKAFGPAGEMGWNSTRWTAPNAPAATWLPPVITGSSATLNFTYSTQSSVYMADEWVLTAPDGRHWNGYFSSPGMPSSVQVQGLSVGTHTFTLTSQWVQVLDPRMPRVTATSTTQTTITITI